MTTCTALEAAVRPSGVWTGYRGGCVRIGCMGRPSVPGRTVLSGIEAGGMEWGVELVQCYEWAVARFQENWSLGRA